jgi:hypothetical protein
LVKRELPIVVVSRFWDSFFPGETPFCFPKFFMAAVLILLFSRLMPRTNGSIEEGTALSDQFMEAVGELAVLNLAIGLEDRLGRKGTDWIFDKLPDDAQFQDYVPTFFELKSHWQ